MEREFLRAREESVLALPVLVRGEKVCNGKGSWRDFLLVSLFFIFSLLRLKKGKPPTWAHADIRRKYSTPRSFSFHLRQGFFTGTILLIFSCFSFTSLSLISLFFPAIGMGEKEVQDDLQRANSRKTMASIHSEAPLFTPLTSSAGFADVLRFCMRNGCKSPEDSPIFTRQTKACLICKHLTGSARIYAPLGSARSVVCFSALD